ncbi:MAG: hypothetical protein AAGA28_05115 [Pseudomonadota bacterium]
MSSKPVIGVDLDGTVLDCRPRQQAVTLQLVPDATPHADALWCFKREGCSTRDALRKLDLAIPEHFDQNWMHLIERSRYLGLDAALPGAPAALRALSSVADLHLITARQNAKGVHDTLARLALDPCFTQVSVVPVGPDSAKTKADCLRATGAVAHCGDSEVDGRSAAMAGIPFWAVTSGQRSETFLLRHTAPARLAPSLHAIAEAHDA